MYNFNSKWLTSYAQEQNLDVTLIETIAKIKEQDARHRQGDDPNWAKKQKELDDQNQELINQLYPQHQQYIGKSLVGESYEMTMWKIKCYSMSH